MNWLLFQSFFLFMGEIILADVLFYLVCRKLEGENVFWLKWHSAGFALIGLIFAIVFGLFNAANFAILGFGIVLVYRLVNIQAGGFKPVLEVSLVGALLGLIVMLNETTQIVDRLRSFQGRVRTVEHISSLKMPLKQAALVHNAVIKSELVGEYVHEKEHLFVIPLVEQDWQPEQEVSAWIDVSPVNLQFWTSLQNPKPQDLEWNGRLFPIYLPFSGTEALYQGAIMNAVNEHKLISGGPSMVYEMVPSDEDLMGRMLYFIGLARFFLWFRFSGSALLLYLSYRKSSE